MIFKYLLLVYLGRGDLKLVVNISGTLRIAGHEEL